MKQLTELKHMPASPGIVRRTAQNQNQTNQNNQNQNYGQTENQNYGQSQSPTQLSTFQQAKSNFSSTTSLNNSGSLNPIYGTTGNRIMTYVENSMFVRKNSLNSSNSDIYGTNTGKIYYERFIQLWWQISCTVCLIVSGYRSLWM